MGGRVGLFLYDTKRRNWRPIPNVGNNSTHATWANANSLFFETDGHAGVSGQWIFRVDLRDENLAPEPIFYGGFPPDQWVNRLAVASQRDTARKVLLAMKSPKTPLAVVNLIRSNSPAAREAGIELLVPLGKQAELAVPGLAARLDRLPLSTQKDVFICLSQLGARSKAATPALLKLLKSKKLPFGSVPLKF